MPIKVTDDLPAKSILAKENVFLIDESKAFHQDIRPLKIAILNLMPNKQTTEVQLLRLLGNTPLQVEITFLHPETHISKNTSSEYLMCFYNTFTQMKEEYFDGLIITGAPVEHLNFSDVSYWDELTEIMEWSKSNVTSTFHICWGAQAGLFYHYGVEKHAVDDKVFGIFLHKTLNRQSPLLRGFDDIFFAPHSRHTQTLAKDITNDNLEILAESEEAGLYIVATKDLKQIFITGHSEYDPYTLDEEYKRDLAKGLSLSQPKYYYEEDDETKPPMNRWRAHSNILFSNWINYIYQTTPYIF